MGRPPVKHRNRLIKNSFPRTGKRHKCEVREVTPRAAQTGNTTTNNYIWWDGALQAKTNYVSGSTNNNSTFYYDDGGHLTSVYIQDGRPRTVTFINDAHGQILQRDEADNSSSNGDPRELHFYFNGLRVGDISNNGTSDLDYATSIAQHIAVPGTGPFRGGSTTGVNYADFDQSYDPINGLNYESTATRYTVQSGDTLESIALALWGDASFWYMLADANGLDGTEQLVEGMSLIVPNKIHNAHNNSDTYKVYDPNEAIGDTSPTAAKPPKKNKCGAFGMILMVAIAVAVAVLLKVPMTNLVSGAGIGAGSAAAASAGLGATIAGGALAGAAGSIVSQGFGVAAGIQNKFSFKGVALAAIGGGVGAGIGDIGKLAGSQFLGDVVTGAARGALTQGIGVATGLQSKFNWAGVAAAGIGNGVTAGLGLSGTMGRAVSGMAGGLAGAAAESLVTGRDFGDTIMASLPSIIGNTIGNLAADRIAGSGQMSAIEKDVIAKAQASANGTLAPRLAYDLAGLDGDIGVTGGGSSAAVITSEAIRAGAGSPVTGISANGRSSTITGLSLTKDEYLAAVKDGLWGNVQGNPNAATGFSNNSEVAAATKRAQSITAISTDNLQASSDLSAFVAAIGPATASAKIGGRDQGYEKFLTFGRNTSGEVVVTGISLVGPQGGSISGLLTPDVISVAHVHYQGLVQPPNSGDNSIAKGRNLPSFVIGATGRNVFEIGRVDGNVSIRSVGRNGTYGQWEGYQSDADKYRIYNGSKYP